MQNEKDSTTTLEVIQAKLSNKKSVPQKGLQRNKPSHSITIRAQQTETLTPVADIIDDDFLDEELKQMLSQHNRKFESCTKKTIVEDNKENATNFKNVTEEPSTRNKRVPITCPNPKVFIIIY